MKTVLVTGASSGIGRETALVFAQNAYQPILVARRKDKLEEVRALISGKYGINAEVIDMDLSQRDSALALTEKVRGLGLTVDVLVNNAGYGLSGGFTAIDEQKQTDMLMLNMVTLTRLTRFFAEDMEKRGGGVIINLASTAAFQPIPGLACYAATKSYVLSMTEAIAYEMRKTGVKLIAICPGPTKSEFAQVAGVESSSMFDKAPGSGELANFIFSSLNSKKYFRIHGFKNRFLKSISGMAPHKMAMGIVEKMMK